MSRRPTSALLLAALVLQLAGPAVPLSLARLAPADTEGQAPRTFKTSKTLPTVEERLGLGAAPLREERYEPPNPADEPSALRKDGTYTLGRGDVNPDAPGRVSPDARPYRSERRAARATEKAGAEAPVALLRTDVSGQITANTTWTAAESPYVVTGAMTVVSPAVLTMEPGVVVKLGSGASLVALEGATILAAGTAQNSIVVTSLKDDAVAGDTNEDGNATSPAPGDWATFGSEGRNTGSTVIAAYGTYQHIQIRYGSIFTGRFSLLTLTDALIENMSTYGLNLEKNPSTTRSFERLTMRNNLIHLNMYGVPSAITIKDSTLTESSSWAVLAYSATAVRLTNNRIDLNDSGSRYAISASSSPMVLRYNSIAWNGDPDTGFVYGLSSTGSTVDAQYNWWGSTTGAQLVGSTNTGGGSQITSSVTHTNWLGKAYEAEHKKGNLPWSAKAGVGVDVATGNLVLTETDIRIPTVGFPLEVTRTYNSLTASTASGVFGNGWTWNYGVNLDVTTDTYGAILTSADGAKHYFKRNADGTFTGEYGLFSVLSYDSTTQEYTLLHPNQDREVFDSAGRLARQVDPDGNTTTLTRDGAGLVTTVTEPTGRTLTFTYASGRIATITDPLGRVYRYTNSGQLTKLEKELSATTVYATCTYTYGANSVLTKRVGCDGDTLEQTFNATTKKVETQTLNGVQVRFAYGPVTDTLTGVVFPQYTTGVWDTFGKLHLYYYTKSNAVFEHDREMSQDAYGTYYFYQEDRWEYATFVSSSYTDILGRETSTERNWRRGTVLASTFAPLNRRTEFTYDDSNNLLTTTDSLDRVTTNTYDAEHHLVSTEDALGNATTTTYTAAGLVETVIDARDAASSFTYDSYGYPETVTTATGETVTFDYDIAGRKLWEETPDGKRTTYTYDGRDNVLTVTDPLGNVTTTTYDAKGRKTVVEDADGFETTFAYDDAKNALLTTTDALGGVVTYTYNPNGTLQKVTDALGHATHFTYDAFGRQATVKDPLNRTAETVYRADGSVSYSVDARGNRTDYAYNSGGELATVTYQDDSATTFLYDGVGNRTRMVDTDGQLDITYDDLNRPLTRTRTSPAGTETITYTYDEVGNLESLGYPGGFSVTYAYDDARRVTSVTDSQNRVTAYDYDGNGRILSVALPNGTSATYAYDDAGRMTSVTHALGQTPFATVGHTYDDRGNRLTRTVDGVTESYTYDALARITEAAYPGNRTVGYGYDATGNRTQKLDGLGTTSYTYDAADQLLSAGDGLRTYDADGQLTKVGAHRSFTWNDRGQLTGISPVPTNAAPTARAGADATGNVDWLMFLDGSASTDPEGIALSFTWTEVAGNPSTGVLRGIHAAKPALLADVAGTYQFDLVVSDGVQTSLPDRVQVTIAAGPPAPVTQTVVPASGMSGYVVSSYPTGRYFTSDMLTGRSSSITYLGAAQFALPTPPPQSTLTGATLTLTGKSVTGNTATDQWSVQLLPTTLDGTWAQATYTTINAATPDRTLTPILVGLGQVVANQPNVWTFTEDDLAVLQARLDGSGKLSLRTRGDTLGTSSRVTWYSGSATVAAKKPTLTLSYTPEPLPDQAPVADAGRDQTLDAPGTATLDGRGSFDAEGAVSLLWTAHAGNPAAVTISDATVAEPSVTFTIPGTYRFALAVTDGADVTTTASTIVTVRSAPLPTSASFAYDGDGDRIAKTVGSVTTRFVVDPIPEHARVLAERTDETWTYHVYGHDLLYSVTGSALTVLHSDPLGSTIATTDASGAVTARMRYDVFGERLDSDASTTPYTFAGERMDLTELQYLRARYYEPAVGRFISRDPFPAQAADTQTFNRYVYVKNNPTNYVDPSGEVAWGDLAVGVVKAIGGVLETVAGVIAATGGIAGTGGGLAACPVSAGLGCAAASGSAAVTTAGAAVAADGALRSANGIKQVWDALAQDPKAQRPSQPAERKVNVQKAESPVWQRLDAFKNGLRRTGQGRSTRYYEWDKLHNDIEVYDRYGRHLGSMDPTTGQIYKAGIPERTITIP